MLGASLALAMLATPLSAAADAVRTPSPVEDCPTGSVSRVPGMGVFHGAFAYCAPHVCAAGGCPNDLRCREVALSIQHRHYSRGGGHGAPPGPREHVSVVTGPCDDPAPGLAVPPPELGAVMRPPEFEAGCQHVRVCVPPGIGEPLGTHPPTVPSASAESASTAATDEEPGADAPDPSETAGAALTPPPPPPPPPARPPPEPTSDPRVVEEGCGCRAAGLGSGGHHLAAAGAPLLFGLVSMRRRRRRSGRAPHRAPRPSASS